MSEITELYKLGISFNEDKITVDEISKAITKLEELKTENGIEFVYGKGKKKK